MAFSIDEVLNSLPVILTELRELRAEVKELKEMQTEGVHRLEAPVYDAKGLMALGYSKHASYSILRSYGNRRQGRLRITKAKLLEYEQARPN